MLDRDTSVQLRDDGQGFVAGVVDRGAAVGWVGLVPRRRSLIGRESRSSRRSLAQAVPAQPWSEALQFFRLRGFESD